MHTVEARDAIGFFYDLESNVFTDEDGYIVWNLFEYITPNDLFLFRKLQSYLVVPHREASDLVCELFWPGEDDY